MNLLRKSWEKNLNFKGEEYAKEGGVNEEHSKVIGDNLLLFPSNFITMSDI